MARSRERMIQILEKTYPNLFVSTTERFDGSEGGIWLSGESGVTDKEGLELFDYYAEDYKEEYYIFGVRKHLHFWAYRAGWFFEWHDAGTMMLWKQ